MSTGNTLAMMPWFPRDWVAATRLFSLAERGAYSDLLFFQWEMKRLPTEREALLRLLGCSASEFDEVWPVVGRKFITDAQGMYNERLEEHRSKSKQLYSDRSLAGKLGGIKSGEARRSKHEANTQAKHQAVASGFASSKTQAPSPSPSVQNTSPNPSFGKGGASRQRRSDRRAEQDEAAIVWDRLIATDGKDRNQRSQAALDVIGGWHAWQMRTPAESASLRKRFLEAYRTLSAVKPNGAKPTERRPDREDEIEREEAARADG